MGTIVLLAALISAALCLIIRRHKKSKYGAFILTLAATLYWAFESGAFHLSVLTVSVVVECLFVWSMFYVAAIMFAVIISLMYNGVRILKIYKHGHSYKSL